MSQLYEFLKSYDYIEATTRIKSKIYEEAQKYIKQSQTRKQESAEDEIPLVESALTSDPVKDSKTKPEIEIATNSDKQVLVENLKIG